MPERINQLISQLEAGPTPAQLEALMAQVMVDAHRQRRADIALHIGQIELRRMCDGGTYGPFEDFKSDQELESVRELVTGLARLLSPVPADAKRLGTTVTSFAAVRRMEDYRQAHNLGLTEFAVKVGCSDRTLRNFRKTSTIQRRILAEIAQAMHTTPEQLLMTE